MVLNPKNQSRQIWQTGSARPDQTSLSKSQNQNLLLNWREIPNLKIIVQNEKQIFFFNYDVSSPTMKRPFFGLGPVSVEPEVRLFIQNPLRASEYQLKKVSLRLTFHFRVLTFCKEMYGRGTGTKWLCKTHNRKTSAFKWKESNQPISRKESCKRMVWLPRQIL